MCNLQQNEASVSLISSMAEAMPSDVSIVCKDTGYIDNNQTNVLLQPNRSRLSADGADKPVLYIQELLCVKVPQ